MSNIIIYDSDHHGARANRCFEKEYANEGPGHAFTVNLGEAARQRGFRIMTADVYLKEGKPHGALAFCITEMVSQNTNRILATGAVPLLCLSFESPLIAKDFYLGIRRLAGRFLYNMQFNGVRERLEQTPTHFSTMYFPVDARTPLPFDNWKERQYLVQVSRNKRAFYSNYTSLGAIVRSVGSRVKLVIQKAIDPWIRSKEIYKDRIEAIRYFSRYDSFYLYGGGWNDRIPGFPASYHALAKKAFRGGLAFDAKLTTMNGFKFSICFENCSFPGYVTEKIFDCFLAGCIPVYYGAPDITDFVPAGTFIDYRQFGSFEALDQHLQQLPDADALQMLQAAKDFLQGPDFDKYYSPNIINSILDKVHAYTPSR